MEFWAVPVVWIRSKVLTMRSILFMSCKFSERTTREGGEGSGDNFLLIVNACVVNSKYAFVVALVRGVGLQRYYGEVACLYF